MLSAIIDADSSIKPDAEVPETAADIIGVLATVGKALEKAENYPPVSKLQIQAEQLRLNMVAAQRRKAFFDKTLSLLEKQREARTQEILYLARVEQLRWQIVGQTAESGVEGPDTAASGPEGPETTESEGENPNTAENESKEKGCLNDKQKKYLHKVFHTQTGVDEKCREKVFKLLAAYSNSWLLGRVPQEQLDYQIINLHHVAALDISEIAFARWESLLGVPINKMVALQDTGVRREDISTIINALGYIGITAAVGAN